jgi:hypothetical protein
MIIEQFNTKLLTGWVVADTPKRIDLAVNNKTVMSTYAGRAAGHSPGALMFRMKYKGLWDYLQPDDIVEVKCEGQVIPISGHGMSVQPISRGKYSFNDLLDKMQNGFVFNQFGSLIRSIKHDPEQSANLASLYNQLRQDLLDIQVEMFAFYGSLLGAIRENGFIGHDHDFDCAYIIPHKDPKQVVQFAADVARHLMEKGYIVTAKATTVYIAHSSWKNVYIDLFHLYFNNHGDLVCPFGSMSTGFKADDFMGVAARPFHNFEIHTPEPAEAIVAFLYGSDWRTPNRGFNWKLDRRFYCKKARFPEKLRNELYWDNYYTISRNEAPSSFQEFIAAYGLQFNRVVEIGCGNGRDSLGFGRGGYPVIGCDLSSNAILAATKQAALEGLRCRFFASDVQHFSAIQNAVDSFRNNEAILFYSRFFLHSLPDDVLTGLLANLGTAAMSGDFVAFEFRTIYDQQNKKVFGGHYRNFINPESVRDKIVNSGLSITLWQHGNGFARYKDEDPFVCRIIARK